MQQSVSFRGGRRTCLAIAAAVVLALGGCGGASSDDAGSIAVARPTIALSCPVANSLRCDRVAFHIRLSQPAQRLEAQVAGRPVRALRTAPYGGAGPLRGETGVVWTGYVQPAGLVDWARKGRVDLDRRWLGQPPFRAPVRVEAVLKTGDAASRVFRAVTLRAGGDLSVAAPVGTGSATLNCESVVFAGSGRVGWRQDASSVGPFGLTGSGRDFSRGRIDPDGLYRTKTPAVVEGVRPVTLSVPAAERDRLGILTVAGDREYARVTFVPCEDRPRTIWPAGLALRDRDPATLIVRVGADPVRKLTVGG